MTKIKKKVLSLAQSLEKEAKSHLFAVKGVVTEARHAAAMRVRDELLAYADVC